jgi:hypothetical protein
VVQSSPEPVVNSVSTTKRWVIFFLFGMLSGLGVAIIGVGGYYYGQRTATRNETPRVAAIQPEKRAIKPASLAPALPVTVLKPTDLKALQALSGKRASVSGTVLNAVEVDHKRYRQLLFSKNPKEAVIISLPADKTPGLPISALSGWAGKKVTATGTVSTNNRGVFYLTVLNQDEIKLQPAAQ